MKVGHPSQWSPRHDIGEVMEVKRGGTPESEGPKTAERYQRWVSFLAIELAR
jgi:hypothetical protein